MSIIPVYSNLQSISGYYIIKNAPKGIFHNQPTFLNLNLNNTATDTIEVIARG